jgi:uncharacterized membrane protein YbhN (UPF0104 family)
VAERAHEIFGIDRRKAVLTLALGLLLVVGVVAAIGQVTSFRHILHALGQADGTWFPVCLGGELLVYAGYIAAYRDVARVDGGPDFSLWTAARVVALGFGAFIVATSAGSLGLDYWALHRAGERPRVAFRRVLALNSVEWMVLALFASLAAVLVIADVSDAPRAMALAWLIVVPLCFLAAVWVSSPRRSERLTSLSRERVELTRAPRTWPRWLWHAARAGFSDAVGGVVIVRHLLARPGRHPGALLGFAVFWTGDIVTLYAALRAFGVHPPLPSLALAYATAYVVTMLPLPAGGSGGIEAGVAFSLNAVGIPLAQALLATLVYRVFTLWLPIAPAGLALTGVRSLEADLAAVGHASIP